MIASYANVGLGIFFLLVLLFVGIGCVVWIAFWLPRGFRATSTKLPMSIPQWILPLTIIGVVMAIFPPLRSVGLWQHTETNQPIPTAQAINYDRCFFGYIPSYRWIGQCFVTETPDVVTTVSLSPDEAYRCSRITWTIDWWFFVPQLVIVGLLLLPFVRAKTATNAG